MKTPNRWMALEWLKAAKDDIMACEQIFPCEHLSHITAFHAQQAIEKTLKALLEYRCGHIPKQHDLITLKNRIAPDFLEEHEDILEDLNDIYIHARYPGDLGLMPDGKPSMESAGKFLELARNLYTLAEDQIR